MTTAANRGSNHAMAQDVEQWLRTIASALREAHPHVSTRKANAQAAAILATILHTTLERFQAGNRAPLTKAELRTLGARHGWPIGDQPPAA